MTNHHMGWTGQQVRQEQRVHRVQRVQRVQLALQYQKSVELVLLVAAGLPTLQDLPGYSQWQPQTDL
jgi:hypothetical protein